MENRKQIETMGEFRDSVTQAADTMKTGHILLMLTDRFDIQKLEDFDPDWESWYRKALEIRMFNKRQEVKWFRASIDKKLQCRSIADEEEDMASGNGTIGESPDYWDEYQYLDIDERRSDFAKGQVYATGGGAYPLPLAGCTAVDGKAGGFTDYKDIKIKLRNYLRYDPDTKRVFIPDWRLVGFVNGEED